MVEIIKPVAGYEGHYSVTDSGRVLTHKGGKTRPMKPDVDTSGYLRIRLCRDGQQRVARVHRLVCEAFNPKPQGREVVNHLNGSKTCNLASNLEWTTDCGNREHAMAAGLTGPSVAVRGSGHPAARLTEDQVRRMRVLRDIDGTSYTALAKEFGVARPTVIHICLRRTWTHI